MTASPVWIKDRDARAERLAEDYGGYGQEMTAEAIANIFKAGMDAEHANTARLIAAGEDLITANGWEGSIWSQQHHIYERMRYLKRVMEEMK